MATDTIINNLNSVIGTKNEIAGIIRENGINPGNTFSDYPDMLRTIISTSGGASGDEIISYISSYLGAYNYIDQTKLSANSYTTASDLPKIDESIIPKETSTYNLGSSSYKYLSTYSTNIYLSGNAGLNAINDYGIYMRINGGNNYMWNMYEFVMANNNYRNQSKLGTNTQPWAYTYTNFLIGQNVYISNAAYLPVNTYWYDGTTYHWLGSLFN